MTAAAVILLKGRVKWKNIVAVVGRGGSRRVFQRLRGKALEVPLVLRQEIYAHGGAAGRLVTHANRAWRR